MSMTARQARLRESMWFVPGVMVVFAIVVSQTMIVADLWLDSRALAVLPDSFLLGVEGSRGILVAIGGSVLAVAATMFSITMSVIATASSTYGPRLVRNFMADRSNQRVLGLLVSTFVYCLMVMRRVQDNGDGKVFVPHIAVYFAILLALINVAAMVYFLHHIADIIQVSTLVSRVRGELEGVVDTLYGVDATSSRVAVDGLPRQDLVVLSSRSGFVTTVDVKALIKGAVKAGGTVELLATPGTHVMVGEPLARVSGEAEAMARVVRDHVAVGASRTPGHDVLFAVQQLVEMAVRAISPSMNDPYTACNAIQELACGLVPALHNAHPEAGWVDGDGEVRLVWVPPSGEVLVDAVFDDLRNYAASDPLVIRAAIRLAERLLRVTTESVAQRVQRQLDELLAAAERAGLAEWDLERLSALRRTVA